MYWYVGVYWRESIECIKKNTVCSCALLSQHKIIRNNSRSCDSYLSLNGTDPLNHASDYRMQKLIKPSLDRRYVDLTVSFAPETDGDDDLPGPPVRYYFSSNGETPWHLPGRHPQTFCVLNSLLSCKLFCLDNLGQGRDLSSRMLSDKSKVPGSSLNLPALHGARKSEPWF